MPLLDRWLVRRACAGDTRSFEKIYERHVARIYNLLRRLTGGDEATAEDLAQETFLAAYRSLASWRGEGALSTWLCGIAVRLYRQHNRLSSHDKDTDALSDTLPADEDVSDPLARCQRAEVLRHLEAGIASLPILYREAFVLAYVEGFAYKEVASLLGIPVGTVQSRLNKAKTLLRLYLTPLLTDAEATPASSSTSPAQPEESQLPCLLKRICAASAVRSRPSRRRPISKVVLKRNCHNRSVPLFHRASPLRGLAQHASLRQVSRTARQILLPPWWVKPLRISGLILLNTTVLSGIAVGGWWFYVNQAPQVIIPTPQVISPNGYPALIAATDKMRDDDAVNNAISKKADGLMAAPRIRVTARGPQAAKNEKKEYTLAEKSALVAENTAALQALRAALKMPAQAPPRRTWASVPSELTRFRQMSRLLLLEGQVWEEKRQYSKAANAYLNIMELGNHFTHGGTLINNLTGLSCETIGRRYLIPLADKLSPADARAILRRLESLQDHREEMADFLSAEKRLTQIELEWLFRTQNYWEIAREFAMDYAIPDENGEPAKLSFSQQSHLTLMLMRYRKIDVIKAHERYMDAVIADAKLPYDRTRTQPELPPDYLNQLLLPAFWGLNHREVDARTQNALLVGKIAIEAFSKETGRLPEGWDVLARRGFLKAAPTDPFSKNGTDSLHYRLTFPGKGTGEYRLYSIGPDGIDNGGMPIPASKTTRDKRYTQKDDNGDFVMGVNIY